MSNRKISGSSISMNQEINVIGKNVITHGTKYETYPALTTPTPDHSKGFSAILPSLMGAVPSSGGVSSAGLSLAMTAVASVCSAGIISISPNPTGSGFLTAYKNVLQFVTNGAYSKNGNLSEDELKKLIMALMANMLEKAGPGYSSWNQILKDLMQNATLGDFLKGVQSAMCALTGDPVNANTGNFIYDKEDLHINGTPPLSFKRTYNRIDTRTGCLGTGWRHNYEIELLIEDDRYVILWEDGREEIYMRDEDDNISPLFGCFPRLKCVEDQFTYKTQEGVSYTFDSQGHLLTQLDANCTGFYFIYNRQGRLVSVSNGHGGLLSYQYDSTSGQLLSAQDHTGRKVTFTYELGRLCKVTNAMGESYSYFYDDNHTLYKIRNPRNVVVLENKYDEKGRTIKQTFADGGEIKYDYQKEDSRTLVTQQDDSKVAYYHDERFRNVKTVYIDGEEVFTYNDRNQLTRRIDKNGNKIKFAYDDKGNRTQVIYPDGSKHNMTYDADNRLLVMSINGTTKIKNTYDSKGNILKSEDARGSCREFRYDDSGKVTELLLPDQSSIHLAYDKRGNIIQATDPLGNTTSYLYDDLNRVVKTTDGNRNSTAYEYDACDQIKKVTNAEGKHRLYEYTQNGKLSKVVDFNGAVTSQVHNSMNQVDTVILPDGGRQRLEYDLMQNISKQTDPNGAETRYQYDPLNRLEQITLATGGIITYAYDPNGNKTGITDANGNHTSIAYDEMNRITVITDPTGASTEYEYDMEGNVISITNPMGKAVTYTYNEAGQKIKETDVLGNTYTYEYNTLGKVSCITDPKQHQTTYEYHPGGTLARVYYPTGHFEAYTYDGNNNLIHRENHKGDFLQFEYDCLNRMICVRSSLGQEQSYAYDAVGNVISMTDTLGHVTHYTYSPGGKLTSVLDAAGNRTEYAYDSMGELITICQHEGGKVLLNEEKLPDGEYVHITQYKRNLLGKVETIIDPLGLKEEYHYDLAGQLVLKKDKEGYETGYAYTPTGEMEQITYADGRSVALTYNPLRQLIEIQDWLGITRIEMDDAGRTKKVTDHKGREIAYEWNRNGEREAVIYPDGRKVSYEYDEFSRLSHLADGDREIRYQYDKEGHLSEKNYPDGIISSYSYNPMGLLSGFAHQKNENMLEQYAFEYDKMGNKTGIRKTRQADSSSIPRDMGKKLQEESGYYSYQYDSLNRLTQVSKNRETLRRYEYDAFGNRIRQETGTTRERYHYNAANQLIRSEGIFPEASYQYDLRGNLTAVLHGKEMVNQYVYDETNRLSQAINAKGEAAQYQYDGLGNRVGRQEFFSDEKSAFHLGKIQPETDLFENPAREVDYLLDRTKAYHNLLEKREITEGSLNIQTYTWDGNVAFMTEGETAHIYLQDELGSTVRLLEMGEDEQTVYGYDEFGQDLYGTQGEMQPFGYTGYRKDRIANTYFAQAREYLAGQGRFGGEDLVKGVIICPITLNRFNYCWNNPLLYFDLSGCTPQSTRKHGGGGRSFDSPERGQNIENMMNFFGVVNTKDLPDMPDNSMVFIENITSIGPVVRGRAIVMDYDKYCEYIFWGVGAGTSPFDLTETLGYVYNVKEPGDYEGLFLGASMDLAADVKGGAIAPSLDKDFIYSEIIYGQGAFASGAASATWYITGAETWTYGKANINWHPNYYPNLFPGSGEMIAKNETCNSQI